MGDGRRGGGETGRGKGEKDEGGGRGDGGEKNGSASCDAWADRRVFTKHCPIPIDCPHGGTRA